MTVGDRIRNKRIELGMTQEELAARMGYKGKSSVCAAETGGDNVTTTKVKKYAQALGVTPESLMGWEIKDAIDEYIQSDRDKAVLLDSMVRNEQKKQQEKAAELYSLYENASPEIQSAVELLLKSAQQSPGSPNNN